MERSDQWHSSGKCSWSALVRDVYKRLFFLPKTVQCGVKLFAEVVYGQGRSTLFRMPNLSHVKSVECQPNDP